MILVPCVKLYFIPFIPKCFNKSHLQIIYSALMLNSDFIEVLDIVLCQSKP